MKTIFRFLGLAILAVVFTVAGGTSVFAQDPPAAATPCDNVEAREALEAKVRTNFDNKDYKIRQLAVDAGEEYIKTYGACEAQPIKDFITYLNGYLPPTKKWIAEEDLRIKKAALFVRFDNALKNDAVTKTGNWDEVYSVGKQILALDPDNLNIIISLGSIALDEVVKTPRNNKYNDDTIRYAKMAIQKVNEGKTSNNFGVFQFSYAIKEIPGDPKSKTKIPESKENTLGWMNYTIGFVSFYGQNNKKDALPYLYKSSQIASGAKALPQVYAVMGDYYFDEVVKIGEEIRVKTEAANNQSNPDAKKVLIDESKALIAQSKAYAERGIDAYARAQGSIDLKKKPGSKGYYDSLGEQINKLYQLRFQTAEGKDAFVSKLIKATLPDPTSVPTPIVEVDPTEVPVPGTTAPGTTPTKPVTTPAPGTAKPAVTPATNGTKPATTPPATTKKPVSVNGTGSSTTTATTVKPVTKKPVTRKKGTR